MSKKVTQSTKINLQQVSKVLSGAYVITDQNVFNLYKHIFPNAYVIKAGEEEKSIKTVEKIAKDMLKNGVTRQGTIAAVGGGVIGDLAGFVASVYMRGINWINLPTTVLAMADSSIGAKTAVNLQNKKNILGTFYPPTDIFLCYEFLQTLSKSQIKNGFAEVIKTCLLDEPAFNFLYNYFLQDMQAHDMQAHDTKAHNKQEHNKQEQSMQSQDKQAQDIQFYDMQGLIALINLSKSIKEEIVKKDFYDNKERKSLNMGHTVGHAIELLYGLGHGESVAIGLAAEIFMANISQKPFKTKVLSMLKPFFKPVPFNAKKITSIALSDKKNMLNNFSNNTKENKTIQLIAPVKAGKVKSVPLSKEDFYKKTQQFIIEYNKFFLY